MDKLELYNRYNWLPVRNGDKAYMEHINKLIEKINEIIDEDTNDNASLSGNNTFTGTNIFNDLVTMLGGLDANSSYILFTQGVYGATAHAGGGQANATMLNGFVNTVTTCATNGDSCKLPSAQAGMFAYVFVDFACAASMNLYPATGETLNGGVVNTPIAMQPGMYAICTCDVDGNWNVLLQLDGYYISNLVGQVSTDVELLKRQNIVTHIPGNSIVTTVNLDSNTWLESFINESPNLVSFSLTGTTALKQVYCKCDSSLSVFDLTDSVLIERIELSSTTAVASDINFPDTMVFLDRVELSNVFIDDLDLINANNLSVLNTSTTAATSALTALTLPTLTTTLTSVTCNGPSYAAITGLGAGSSHAILSTVLIQNNDALISIDISGDSDLADAAGSLSIADCPLLTTITIGAAAAACTSIDFSGNALLQSRVDDILLAVDTAATVNGNLLLDGGTNASPTGGVLNANYVSLLGKGWTVSIN